VSCHCVGMCGVCMFDLIDFHILAGEVKAMA
jgi:hypothetical protein